MKKIAVLIDFTSLCNTSVKTAAGLAQGRDISVTLIHIASQNEEGNKAKIEERFSTYVKELSSQEIEVKTEIGFGDFEMTVSKLIRSQNFDLAVVGTHGIKGIMQTLFGSNILSLLDKLTVPVLVVQENSPILKLGTEILLPMSSHNDFNRKVEFAATFSKLLHSKVVLYMIQKTDEDDLEILKNKKAGLEYLKNHQIPHEFIEEEATLYSYGYGKQIIQYASDSNTGLISIMTRVSTDKTVLGKAEKERILLNEAAIPVLCING
jgi:nucleotide-binding universal stress UspA family protein